MDRSSTPRLKLLQLTVLLLMSANILCLHGNPVAVDHDLQCVNDYLFTINCTMSIAPSENTSGSSSSYWLTFTQKWTQDKFMCMLTKKRSGHHFCSVKTSIPMTNDDYDKIFTDLDAFGISLCHNGHDGNETCEVLDDQYTPVTNIKPNAPCCLTVRHNSSQYHFTWKSTYEEFKDYTSLVDSFKYQLHYFKRDKKVISHDINTDRTKFSVDDRAFVPDTVYAARVRSSPNLAFYKGQWSDWSSEVHWNTESSMSGESLPKNTQQV
uniref:Fibronectin type-III domain-containing protein n=1 Tax=Scophthalmus maximus TaxID=52904 RepID=A0A8D3AM89_SCOMX